MNLKGIMLSEIKQSQKDKYCIISLYMRYLKSSNSQKQRIESWLPMAQGGDREALFKGHKASIV